MSRAVLASAFALFVPLLVGCGGHEARTLKMRSALDEGSPKAAIAAVNEELDVKKDGDLPKEVVGDNALLVLDRASIQQSVAQFKESKHDFEAADKAIDMLDLAHNAGDSIGQYVFSDSAGKYQAPPYEKLLINTLNLLNYLELHDLDGGLVEVRRLAVIQRYFKDQLKDSSDATLGLGALLAGFAHEKSGNVDEALRYYDEALQFAGSRSLKEAVNRLLPRGSYASPRLRALVTGKERAPGLPKDAPKEEALPESKEAPRAAEPEDERGDVLFVVGYGRVPHKIAERMPIGLALTLFAGSLSPNDTAAANRIAAQGLVTWINYPTLAKGQGEYETPACQIDGSYVQLEEAVNVSDQVRAQWKKIEGKVIVSAITRMIARFAVGAGIQTAAGKDNVVGLLASLAAQGTLSALDTPDTRSWETLPARVAVSRMRIAPGKHHVRIEARGWKREQDIVVAKGGWHVVSLLALR